METKTQKTGKRTARLCIQTVRYQDLIAYHFRVYMVSAVGILTLLFFAGKIGAGTALTALGIGSFSILILLVLLLHARKKSLLSIDDPELRKEAHEVMIAYLARKPLSKKDRQMILNHRKACHCGLCR